MTLTHPPSVDRVHGPGANGVDHGRPGPLVVHVVGARPNFMKMAPVLRALEPAAVRQAVVHTGQHYDRAMSDVFFHDLGLPEPDLNLGVGSGAHAPQTAALLTALDEAFATLGPDLVVVYGDVNSTLAATVVASKRLLPLAHVEAGLRSFDPTMPEEVNRRVTDCLADMLFATSPEAVAHLAREGVAAERIHLVGNPMIDTLLAHRDHLRMPTEVPVDAGSRFAVATLHRPANVDTPAAAERMVAMLRDLSEVLPVVLPLHPRGRPRLEAAGLCPSESLHVVAPLGYVEFLAMVSRAAIVVTDSGGIQEETTFLGVPCLTVRPNTERPITMTHGTNRLVVPEQVAVLARQWAQHPPAAPAEGPPLWDGRAGERIARLLLQHLQTTTRRSRPAMTGTRQ